MRAAWRLRAAAVEDVDAVLDLQRATPELPQWGRSVWEQLLRACGEASAEVGRRRAVFVIEAACDVVGVIVVGLTAGVAEIESVAVAEAWRRCGLARALCRQGIAWAEAAHAESIELEVRASNEAARTLYEGLGFAEQGRRRGYYHDPVEDAVLMRRAFAAASR